MSNEEPVEREGERTRRPTHPGEILKKEFLEPARISQTELADALDVDVKTVHRLVNEKTDLSPKMAVRLANAFEMTADFWLNLQNAVDLYEVRQSDHNDVSPISFAKNTDQIDGKSDEDQDGRFVDA